jgi:hypothetical protein
MWGFFLCRITGCVVDNVEVPGEEGVSFISSEEMLTLEQHIWKCIEIYIFVEYLPYLRLGFRFTSCVKKNWGS